MKLISLPFVSYPKRVLSSMLNWGTFMFLTFILLSFLYISKYAGYLLICCLVIYVINAFREARRYITDIQFENNDLKIDYYWFNKGPKKLVTPIKFVTVNWFDSVKGNISASRIVIKSSEFIINQYCVGGWKKDVIKNIHNRIKSF